MNLSKKQQLVLNAVKQFPGVQNNEAALTAAVWRIEGWSDYNTLEQNLQRVTHPETIARRRRELHQMGLIEYSDEAMKERTEAFTNERDMHSAVPWL